MSIDPSDEINSTSNSCFSPPAPPLRSIGGRMKDFLRGKRSVFRLVHGMRALRTGWAGLRQGKRGSKAHILGTLDFVRGASKIRGRPMNITIEPTNICNLRCPVCETGAGILKRSPEHLSLRNFQIMIDKIADNTNTLMFYFMGEPFLNKQAYDMIAYAKSKGIPFITTCTNGDLVNPEKLASCGLDDVSFQIGGMTQKTHETYRVNSNIERVMANLEETIRWRNQLGSNLKVAAGFILMKHNEHEVPEFQKTMAELGVDRATVIDPCVRTVEEGHRYLPTNKDHWQYDPASFANGVLKPRSYPPNECPWLYYSISIHVNGGVVPCCRDPLGENVMGNLITQSLEEVWNGEKFQNFRRQLHADQSKINICRLCSSYGPSAIK